MRMNKKLNFFGLQFKVLFYSGQGFLNIKRSKGTEGRKNSPTWSIIHHSFYQALAFWFYALAHNIDGILLF